MGLTVGAFGGSKTNRRRLLAQMASAAAAFGLGASDSRGEVTTAKGTPEAAIHSGEINIEQLTRMAQLRSYQSRRSSSYDQTGGNNDSTSIEAGQSSTLLVVRGAGVITHMWFTINSRDPLHLKNLVLRAYWDGEQEPSVEVPIGDFFGLGLGEYFLYDSALLCVAPIKALNCYFQMPFGKSARLTVSNEGEIKTDALYFAVDYVSLTQLPADLGYFHAQYRQAAPCKGWTDDWKDEYKAPVGDKINLSGEGNYVFMEATGKGHFIGVTHSVLQNQDQWFGEGDDMIFIDDQKSPAINGTGTEDYYNGAWAFGDKPYAYPFIGNPFVANPNRIGGRYCLYRWHMESPIAFEKSIRVTMEHGHANHRSDNFYSTAYWYQTEPHVRFADLPPTQARVPRVLQVGGAGAAAPLGEK